MKGLAFHMPVPFLGKILLCNTFLPPPVLTGETVCAYKTMNADENTLATLAVTDPVAFAALFDCF
jgi:hypothetical protein